MSLLISPREFPWCGDPCDFSWYVVFSGLLSWSHVSPETSAFLVQQGGLLLAAALVFVPKLESAPDSALAAVSLDLLRRLYNDRDEDRKVENSYEIVVAERQRREQRATARAALLCADQEMPKEISRLCAEYI